MGVTVARGILSPSNMEMEDSDILVMSLPARDRVMGLRLMTATLLLDRQ